MKRVHVVLCVGSNCCCDNVRAALCELSLMLEDFRCSRVYETPAVGGGERNYANAVVTGFTCGAEAEFDEALKRMELRAGRDEAARRSVLVPLDVDIVMWDGETVRPWDARQQFFLTGYSELAGSVVKI